MKSKINISPENLVSPFKSDPCEFKKFKWQIVLDTKKSPFDGQTYLNFKLGCDSINDGSRYKLLNINSLKLLKKAVEIFFFLKGGQFLYPPILLCAIRLNRKKIILNVS